MQSKPALDTALAHRSIRQFTTQVIEPDKFEAILNAGRMASTSNHLQCVSIIRVTDPQLRAQLREASGMAYVESCAEFLVFCLDFNKHKQLNPEAQLDWAEVSLIGAVDTGIMAQNMLLVAESLGLGGVYIGALRNQIEQVATLLQLPEFCVPLVGLCLGYPAQAPMLKPRFPQAMICHENHYQPLDQAEFAKYDAQLTAYYQARSGKAMSWLDGVQKTLNQPVRPQILPFFQRQGLLKR